MKDINFIEIYKKILHSSAQEQTRKCTEVGLLK